MGRYTIEARIIVDVNGDDEAEAFEHFADAINEAAGCAGIRDITVNQSSTTPVPFVVPAGAERWGKPASLIRFAEDSKLAAMHDGSWWWSDGHAALRCEGDPPPDFKRVNEDGKLGEGLPKKPRETIWGLVEVEDGWRRTLARRAEKDRLVAIQTKFIDLVETVYPGVRWLIGGSTQPVAAVSGDTTVALVMPFRADSLKPLDTSGTAQVIGNKGENA